MQQIAVKPHIRPFYYDTNKPQTEDEDDDEIALGQYYQNDNGVWVIRTPDNVNDPHTFISTDIIVDSPYNSAEM